MSRQLEFSGKRYWILSDPDGSAWKATVVEILDDAGAITSAVGIEAKAETRGAADDAAERKLRRMVRGAGAAPES
ncbi:MAG: hypothetical protein IT176_02725 [Acidobacteria bacterium]|nr:hypothetical protein [Acidobacteriota bacterium]